MPATTRSQTTLEEKGISSSRPAPKRKAVESHATPAKKQKKQPGKDTTVKPKRNDNDNDDDGDVDEETITINRAPVLELWASCVTQLLHPSLPWTTCLSVGGAISTITAISKGRSIGTLDKPDPGKQQEKREKRQAEQAELDEVDVMNFHLKLKNGSAMVGEQPKKGNEEALKKKFGEESYRDVKKTFEDVLQSWKGKEDGLSKRAFGMYEDFRPSIPAGQKGWGMKGQLTLGTIRSAVVEV